MDDSVIVLDSSDDETKESNSKKSQKRINRKVISCVNSSSNHSKPKLIKNNKTAKSANHHMVVAPHLPPIRQKLADISEKDKTFPDGKDFHRKITTGEITIVPITVPLSIASNNSPKIITATANSIEIIPKLTSDRQSPSNSATSSNSGLKRIKPLTVSNVVSKQAMNNNDSDAMSKDSFATNDDQTASDSGINEQQSDQQHQKPPKKRLKMDKTPLNEAFTQLLDACRAADKSNDMEKMINRKLIRYYQSVHPDYVNSKSFCKQSVAVAAEIRAEPHLVYTKLSHVVEELNIRRKGDDDSGIVGDVPSPTNETSTSTGDKHKDNQVRKLNKALYVLKKKIAKLDESEVNWDDEENSTFLILERYKKRAWEIYQKICDITGESKNAQRLVKKPIKFKGTKYPEFNRTLQAFVNDTESFPDMFDVLRCLEHCNSKYNYKMSKDEIKFIAQDAFQQIGEVLQKRRKHDLYETASYFTGTHKDPALDDSELQSKLIQNQKFHDRIKDLLNKYSMQQDPERNDSNSSGEALDAASAKPYNMSGGDKTSDSIVELDDSITSIKSTDTNKCHEKNARTTTYDDNCHNFNNNAKFDGKLAIVAVTSLQPDDPLFENNKDESNNIIISDDEDL